MPSSEVSGHSEDPPVDISQLPRGPEAPEDPAPPCGPIATAIGPPL